PPLSSTTHPPRKPPPLSILINYLPIHRKRKKTTLHSKNLPSSPLTPLSPTPSSPASSPLTAGNPPPIPYPSPANPAGNKKFWGNMGQQGPKNFLSLMREGTAT
ncbi:MAG: hypothetical protein N2035_10090, partial [Chthoniobacterales bacterium]|nr:hypothetical protein [Chthoniobacterales bacterium]